ncbi:MAG: DUF4124 domain-containing protein [Rubrivivax sp.]|nr:DUF4124 domain-containing protein [Rubrivivax sp.]
MAAAALLFAAALTPTPADAQWRWRDATGRINVSDRPPPREVPDKDILSRPAVAVQPRRAATADAASTPASGASAAAPAASAARPPGAASASGLQAEVEARRRRAEQEQAARAKAEEEKLAAQRAENCRRARSQVATLESGIRIARVNERGEREVLDDRARAEEMRAARAVVASDCR